MSSASNSYAYLQALGYINGTSSTISSPTQSPLTWFSSKGNMPQGGPATNAAAVTDITAWVAAGAQDN